MSEVIVDLPAHPLDLRADDGRGLVLAGRGQALGLLAQDREGGLDAVSQVAGLGDGALHELRPVIEEGVEVIDQGLHFLRVTPFEALLPALAHRGEVGLQLAEGGQDAR